MMDSKKINTDAMTEMVQLGDLHFYRGLIYKNARKGEDTLQIRILPHLKGVDEKDLPYYSCFFPETLISGAPEKIVGESLATSVWVVSTSDFKTGWILGLAEEKQGLFATKKKTNWDIKSFEDLCEGNAKMNKDIFNASELKVIMNTRPIAAAYESAGMNGSGQKNPTRASATFLDVLNMRTGDRIMLQQSGTCFAFLQDRIYLRVGSPNSKASFIDMDPSEIVISANSIDIQHRDKLSVGKHFGHLALMLGAPTAVDGSPLVPLLDTHC